MGGLIQTYGLDDVVTVGNTCLRPAIFKHATAGSTSLIGDVTTSGGVGNALELRINGTSNCVYGLFLGLFPGFAQPVTSSYIFFGVADALNYILMAGSGIGGGMTIASSGNITVSTALLAATAAISCTTLTASTLTSGRVPVVSTGGLLVDNAHMTFATDTLTVTKELVKAGSSTSNVKVGGTLKVDTTAVGNVGVGEDDLITYSVPASTLGTNGDFIEFDMAGTFAANANSKRVRIKFGATTLFDTTALIFNGVDWRAQGKIIRTGAATQKAICTFTTASTLLTQLTDYTTPAETLSGAVTLKATGEATSNNDVVQEFLTIESYLGA